MEQIGWGRDTLKSSGFPSLVHNSQKFHELSPNPGVGLKPNLPQFLRELLGRAPQCHVFKMRHQTLHSFIGDPHARVILAVAALPAANAVAVEHVRLPTDIFQLVFLMKPMFAGGAYENELPAVTQVRGIGQAGLLSAGAGEFVERQIVELNQFGIDHSRILPLGNAAAVVEPVTVIDQVARKLLNEAVDARDLARVSFHLNVMRARKGVVARHNSRKPFVFNLFKSSLSDARLNVALLFSKSSTLVLMRVAETQPPLVRLNLRTHVERVSSYRRQRTTPFSGRPSSTASRFSRISRPRGNTGAGVPSPVHRCRLGTTQQHEFN